MKVKTSELTGAALDWAVATCEGYTELHKVAGRMAHEPQFAMMPPRREYGAMDLWELGFSTDWAQGGPIIEREGMGLTCGNNTWGVGDGRWEANHPECLYVQFGPTPLTAAMRCYVASRLGDEVEVPDELMGAA